MVTSDAEPVALRPRIHDILEMGVYGHRPGRVFDWLMIGLIIANVVAVAAETVPGIGARHREFFLAFEIFSIAVFTIEYGLRLWVAAEGRGGDAANWRVRLRYALTPLAIIDLLAILPFYLVAFAVPDMRFLRIFRLVRLLKLVRYSPALLSLTRVLYQERRALIAALVIMSGLLFLSSSTIYFVERDAQPDAFSSIPASLWWAVTTLTTVGYGDVVPITPLGKMVGGIVMIFGLAFYAIPIGIVASAFSSEIHRRDFVVRYGLVARVPLFEDLGPEAIAEVSRLLHSIVVGAGAVISHRGQVAEGMYFLVTGEAEARAGGRAVRFLPGAFFGEISLFKETFQEVTVVALTRCQLMLLESHEFRHLLTMQPEIAHRLYAMMRSHLDEHVEAGEITAADRDEIMARYDHWRAPAAAQGPR